MESSPESVRPLKRVKYVQQDDTVPVDMTASDIRGPESMSGPLVTDVPMFDNPWALTTDLSSPSQVLFNLHEDLGTPWPQTFTGEEVNLRPSSIIPTKLLCSLLVYAFAFTPLYSSSNTFLAEPLCGILNKRGATMGRRGERTCCTHSPRSHSHPLPLHNSTKSIFHPSCSRLRSSSNRKGIKASC